LSTELQYSSDLVVDWSILYADISLLSVSMSWREDRWSVKVGCWHSV